MNTYDDSSLDQSSVSNDGGNDDLLCTKRLPWDSERQQITATNCLVLHKSEKKRTMNTYDDSSLDQSSVSNDGGNVDLLCTERLPWDSDRQHITSTRYLVFHKNDPRCTWYRPSVVFLRDQNMTSLFRYLHDQEVHRQYTIGDMMLRTGHHNPDWKWLFNSASEQANFNDQMDDQMDEQRKLCEAQQGTWLPNERACFAYNALTYVPDDPEHDDASPYISLFRSVGSIGSVDDILPFEVEGENADELKGVDLKLREAKLLEDARNEIKKARRARSNRFLRAFTTPFRWLRKQFS